MKNPKPLILLLGIFLCALCAVYPPRRINNTSSFQFDHRDGGKLRPYDIPRALLFAPEFAIYRARGGAVFPAEVDSGQLLAQLVLIGALTGALILIPNLRQLIYCPSVSKLENERSPDA